MIRNTIFGLAAAAIFIAAAGGLVSATLASTTASASHPYVASNKPAYLKGGIAKNCLDHQGECGLIAQ